MSTLAIEIETPLAVDVHVKADRLIVELDDGRILSVPLAWFPRILHATPAERDSWRLIGNGEGIHWPGPDEDISVSGLLSGNKADESPQSFDRWLTERSGRGSEP